MHNDDNAFKVAELKFHSPDWIGKGITEWFDEKANAGTPVADIISVTHFVVAVAAAGSLALHGQQQNVTYVFVFIIIYL